MIGTYVIDSSDTRVCHIDQALLMIPAEEAEEITSGNYDKS